MSVDEVGKKEIMHYRVFSANCYALTQIPTTAAILAKH
jgi:hypothetical protein